MGPLYSGHDSEKTQSLCRLRGKRHIGRNRECYLTPAVSWRRKFDDISIRGRLHDIKARNYRAMRRMRCAVKIYTEGGDNWFGARAGREHTVVSDIGSTLSFDGTIIDAE